MVSSHDFFVRLGAVLGTVTPIDALLLTLDFPDKGSAAVSVSLLGVLVYVKVDQ